MNITKYVFLLILLIAALACGTLSVEIQNPTATTDLIAESVQATLDAMESNTPQPDGMGPVSPVWLEDEALAIGETFPAYLSGLSFRKDSVWLIDQNGLSHLVMGQPAKGELSLDGTGFLYSSSTDLGEDIFYYTMAGDIINQLTFTPDVYESNYKWWPQRSNVIVFNFVPKEENGPWYGYIGAYDFVTGEYITIDDQFGSGSAFGLSPDGERIAYLQGSQPMIYTWKQGYESIDFQGLGLDYTSYSTPAWSPDGELVAFHAGGGNMDEATGAAGHAIVIFNPALNSVKVLHEYSSQGQRGGPELAWSPDGEWLAVVNPGEVDAGVGPMALWVLKLDGSEEHNLGFSSGPIWNPDGSLLIFLKWPPVGTEGPHQIAVVEKGEWEPRIIEQLEGAFLDKWIYLP